MFTSGTTTEETLNEHVIDRLWVGMQTLTGTNLVVTPLFLACTLAYFIRCSQQQLQHNSNNNNNLPSHPNNLLFTIFILSTAMLALTQVQLIASLAENSTACNVVYVFRSLLEAATAVLSYVYMSIRQRAFYERLKVQHLLTTSYGGVSFVHCMLTATSITLLYLTSSFKYALSPNELRCVLREFSAEVFNDPYLVVVSLLTALFTLPLTGMFFYPFYVGSRSFSDGLRCRVFKRAFICVLLFCVLLVGPKILELVELRNKPLYVQAVFSDIVNSLRNLVIAVSLKEHFTVTSSPPAAYNRQDDLYVFNLKRNVRTRALLCVLLLIFLLLCLFSIDFL